MPTRGRPRGSYGKKKTREVGASQQSLASSLLRGLTQSDHSDSEEEQLTQSLNATIDKALKNISRELNSIKEDFNKAIEDLRLSVRDLQRECKTLKEQCGSLSERVKVLEEDKTRHESLINKQERFSRRSNVRIVGVTTTEGEDCVEMAKRILEETGVPNCQIERAHRDGRVVNGRDRHLLVKLSFYQDKVTVLKNARRALADKPYYIIEDLTRADLQEKRRWKQEVQALYQRGTKLRFTAGLWRGSDGKPYQFN